MLLDFALNQTGIILRLKLRQDGTGAAPGNGKTGLTSASAGLRVAAIADNEATTTSYTSGGSTIDTIATLGTYAAPTGGHCRFREVDATSHPGVYELQLENSRFAVTSAKSLLVSITGVAGMADCDVLVPLRAVNPYDGAAFGLSRLVAPPANWSALLVSAGGVVKADVQHVNAVLVAGAGTSGSPWGPA